MIDKRLVYFDDINSLSITVAEYIKELSQLAIAKNGFFSIAFSGGKTPLKLFKILSDKPFKFDINWKHIYVFQVDERFVPYENEYNNFRNLNQLLLQNVPIPKNNIFSIDTNIDTPEKAAEQYERKLKNFFDQNKISGLDLLLLGIGKDGHTASIFPEYLEFQKDVTKWVVAVKPPEVSIPAVARVSFTLNFINKSRNIIFLISGKDKESIVNEILNNKKSYPVTFVKAKYNLKFYISKN